MERCYPSTLGVSFTHVHISLVQAERNYDEGDRELLAIKLDLKEWRCWLKGTEQPLIICKGRKNLKYLQTVKRLNYCQARWALFFTRFNPTILPAACIIGALTWETEGLMRNAEWEKPDPGTGPPN